MNPLRQLQLTRSLASADAAHAIARTKADADLIASMRQIITFALTPEAETAQLAGKDEETA